MTNTLHTLSPISSAINSVPVSRSNYFEETKMSSSQITELINQRRPYFDEHILIGFVKRVQHINSKVSKLLREAITEAEEVGSMN